jgi:spermidine/putrescine transport system ATP-binding protein
MSGLRRFLPGRSWLGAYAAIYVGFLYLPVIFLPIFSINTAATPKFPLSGYTLKWYEQLPHTPALLDAAWNSLIVGISASVLATTLGILAARSITRYRFPGRRSINGLIMAPLVLPEIIVAISMLLVMLQLGLSLSLFTVVLGHVLICIPYSMTVLISGFEGFDRSLEEASADLGESAFGTFRRVTLPMVMPAIISSLLVSFTISLDEFIIAFFLTRSYGAFKALDDANLVIREGEFFSLLGPSGCGKTTLLRMIAGFDNPTSGTIAVDGQRMEGIPANRRPTNMVFQSYAIFPHLNVEQNVAYGLKRLRLDSAEEKRRVEEALGQVSLSGLGKRGATELSGGQRQRVALARALVMRPKVLLLDEPLSALDKKLREQMQVELRRLQQAVGITFVLVTHDQYEALAMSDRIAVMFGGRIAQVASPKEIYQRPVNRQVADFLGGMNFVKAEIVEEQNASLLVDTLGFGRIKTDKPKAFVRNGSGATLGIRPERLRVLWDDSTAKFEVSGKVVERHYFGEITHLIVEIPGLEKPLSVTETNDFGADDIPVGSSIRLAYDPEALVALAD